MAVPTTIDGHLEEETGPNRHEQTGAGIGRFEKTAFSG